MIRSRNSLKDEWNRHGERMISLGSPVIYDISQETIFVSQTKINPLLCRGMKDLQIKERAPVLV